MATKTWNAKTVAGDVLKTLEKAKALGQRHSLTKIELLSKLAVDDALNTREKIDEVALIVWPDKKSTVARSEFVAICVAAPRYDEISKLALKAVATDKAAKKKTRAHNAYLAAARYAASHDGALPDVDGCLPADKPEVQYTVDVVKAEVLKALRRVSRGWADEGYVVQFVDAAFTVTKAVPKAETPAAGAGKPDVATLMAQMQAMQEKMAALMAQ